MSFVNVVDACCAAAPDDAVDLVTMTSAPNASAIRAAAFISD
jgi:hypothetical protein